MGGGAHNQTQSPTGNCAALVVNDVEQPQSQNQNPRTGLGFTWPEPYTVNNADVCRVYAMRLR